MLVLGTFGSLTVGDIKARKDDSIKPLLVQLWHRHLSSAWKVVLWPNLGPCPFTALAVWAYCAGQVLHCRKRTECAHAYRCGLLFLERASPPFSRLQSPVLLALGLILGVSIGRIRRRGHVMREHEMAHRRECYWVKNGHVGATKQFVQRACKNVFGTGSCSACDRSWFTRDLVSLVAACHEVLQSARTFECVTFS